MLFSELAVAYLFFGGAGAGTCAVMGVLECANLGRYGTRADLSHYKEIAAPFDSVGAKKLASAP